MLILGDIQHILIVPAKTRAQGFLFMFTKCENSSEFLAQLLKSLTLIEYNDWKDTQKFIIWQISFKTILLPGAFSSVELFRKEVPPGFILTVFHALWLLERTGVTGMNNNELRSRGILGTNLQFFRRKAGFTQEQVAQALNINRSTYTKYETGVTEPNVASLREIAALFGVDLNTLMNEGGFEKIKESDLSEEIGSCKVLVGIFSLLSDEDKEKLLNYAFSLEKKEKSEKNENNSWKTLQTRGFVIKYSRPVSRFRDKAAYAFGRGISPTRTEIQAYYY